MTFDSYMRKGALSYDVRGDGRRVIAKRCWKRKVGAVWGKGRKIGRVVDCPSANRMTDGARARRKQRTDADARTLTERARACQWASQPQRPNNPFRQGCVQTSSTCPPAWCMVGGVVLSMGSHHNDRSCSLSRIHVQRWVKRRGCFDKHFLGNARQIILAKCNKPFNRALYFHHATSVDGKSATEPT